MEIRLLKVAETKTNKAPFITRYSLKCVNMRKILFFILFDYSLK